MKPRPHVLLVEDNEDDVLLTRQALHQEGLSVELTVVGDGREALALLRAPPPGGVPVQLVLLDLNLPVLDGAATLDALLADPALRALPVVVLTTSTSAPEIARLYARRASGVVIKPLDFGRYRQILVTVLRYWFDAVTLPGTAV